jgi:hypothetical protein
VYARGAGAHRCTDDTANDGPSEANRRGIRSGEPTAAGCRQSGSLAAGQPGGEACPQPGGQSGSEPSSRRGVAEPSRGRASHRTEW